MHPGELIYHFVNVVIITSVVAPWVLWRYRLAVLRGMRAHSGEVVPTAEFIKAERHTSHLDPGAVLLYLRRSRQRITIAVVAAICLPSLLMTALYLLISDLPRSPTHVWLVATVFASAAVPMIAVFLAIPFWRALAVWFAAIAACALSGVVFAMIQRIAGGNAPTLDQFMIVPYFLLFVATQWSAPLLLLLATGSRKLRGVAPITLAGLLTFGLAPLLGSQLTGWAASTVAGGAWLLSIGTNAGFFLLAVPTGWLAWRRLKAVARAYERKRLSDAQLLARTWWLMFVAALTITLANVPAHRDKWLVIFTVSGLAYLMFPLLLAWILRWLRLEEDRPPARILLLLRAFGYTKRTEQLFDRIAAGWRFCGPITMIAAPDVIARTVDPEDFLSYLTGRLTSVFVHSREDLEKRLAALDQEPDPDGRYRVNEFCCRSNTWQATVVELMRRADAVIMDLRGVAASRRGCEFELQQLAARLRPEQIVLVVDQTTDRAFIEKTLLSNGAAKLPHIAEIRSRMLRESDRVFARLISAAYSAPASTTASPGQVG